MTFYDIYNSEWMRSCGKVKNILWAVKWEKVPDLHVSVVKTQIDHAVDQWIKLSLACLLNCVNTLCIPWGTYTVKSILFENAFNCVVSSGSKECLSLHSFLRVQRMHFTIDSSEFKECFTLYKFLRVTVMILQGQRNAFHYIFFRPKEYVFHCKDSLRIQRILFSIESSESKECFSSYRSLWPMSH